MIILFCVHFNNTGTTVQQSVPSHHEFDGLYNNEEAARAFVADAEEQLQVQGYPQWKPFNKVA